MGHKLGEHICSIKMDKISVSRIRMVALHNFKVDNHILSKWHPFDLKMFFAIVQLQDTV